MTGSGVGMLKGQAKIFHMHWKPLMFLLLFPKAKTDSRVLNGKKKKKLSPTVWPENSGILAESIVCYRCI